MAGTNATAITFVASAKLNLLGGVTGTSARSMRCHLPVLTEHEQSRLRTSRAAPSRRCSNSRCMHGHGDLQSPRSGILSSISKRKPFMIRLAACRITAGIYLNFGVLRALNIGTRAFLHFAPIQMPPRQPGTNTRPAGT